LAFDKTLKQLVNGNRSSHQCRKTGWPGHRCFNMTNGSAQSRFPQIQPNTAGYSRTARLSPLKTTSSRRTSGRVMVDGELSVQHWSEQQKTIMIQSVKTK